MSELGKSLNKVTLTLLVKTGDDGKMFGSVTSGSIADALKTQLEVSLDKDDYRAGDQMKLQVASRFDGKASIAIVSDKVNDIRIFDVKNGDNVLTIPVSADWGSGAYAVAIAHRPLDQAQKRMPGRALGLARFIDYIQSKKK